MGFVKPASKRLLQAMAPTSEKNNLLSEVKGLAPSFLLAVVSSAAFVKTLI